MVSLLDARSEVLADLTGRGLSAELRELYPEAAPAYDAEVARRSHRAGTAVCVQADDGRWVMVLAPSVDAVNTALAWARQEGVSVGFLTSDASLIAAIETASRRFSAPVEILEP